MKRICMTLLALSFAFFGGACSLVTDFDEGLLDQDAGTETEKYALSDAVPDPVTITLASEDTYEVGAVQFTLGKALPGEPATLKQLLTDGTVGLVVTNTVTGVNADLLFGEPVEQMPTKPGQYWVEIAKAKDSVTIHFYNGWDDNGTVRSLKAGSDYEAAVTVISNDYFEVDEFTRPVIVQ
ncbi:MAG: hypothetical protein PHU25_07230 [Deltaproteobacteria bacterium]|nr:hypothetical protein [Deltaproteobacteria bacterium]